MGERIQRQRTRGWKMPEGAVYVGRPTRWGNPWKVVPHDDGFTVCYHTENVMRLGWPAHQRREAHRTAVELYERALMRGNLDIVPLEVVRELGGRDLACWCPLDQPCHADVLLELANRDTHA